MLSLMLAAALAQANQPYPRTYEMAQQCSAMLTVIGLTREEPETGPMRRLGARANLLAAELAPSSMTPQQFAADAVSAQNTLFMIVGRPGEPGFAAEVEALAPEAEKCRAMLEK